MKKFYNEPKIETTVCMGAWMDLMKTSPQENPQDSGLPPINNGNAPARDGKVF